MSEELNGVLGFILAGLVVVCVFALGAAFQGSLDNNNFKCERPNAPQ